MPFFHTSFISFLFPLICHRPNKIMKREEHDSVPLRRERAHIHLARRVCMSPQCVSMLAQRCSPHPGAPWCIPPFSQQAGRHPHTHRPRPSLPKVYSANGLHICPRPSLVPTGKPCQTRPGKGTSFSPTQSRDGAWGWHMASPQDHALPASSCGEAHCQLREGTSPFSEEK